jgi:pSer/pThr/pTyr-binding forkhead associated (FHA) protein
LLGRELFRFTTQTVDDAPPQGIAQSTVAWSGSPKLQTQVAAKLEHIKLNGQVLGEYKLEKPETTLGRTTGDLTFKDDPYMSSTHARIVNQQGQFFLQDLHSRNGVYRRVRDEVELRDADEFFMGEQLFRVEVKSTG